MKGIYAIVIAYMAFWTVISANEDLDQNQSENFIGTLSDTYAIITKCPYPEKDNYTTTNLAHEDNCEKFYKCHVQKGVIQDCPKMDKKDPKKRLHYNILEQVCDWPWRAGCVTCGLPDKNGECFTFKIAHEDDPDRYYECEKDCKKKLKTCDDDTYFSRTCQACVKNPKGGKCP